MFSHDVFSTQSFPLIVSSLSPLSPQLLQVHLRAPEGKDLPLLSCGAQLQIIWVNAQGQSIPLPSAVAACRSQQQTYELVLECSFESEPLAIGQQLECRLAEHRFHLHADAAPALLIGVGLGAIAIKPLAETLALRGRRQHFHYLAANMDATSPLPFADSLHETLGRQLSCYSGDQLQACELGELMAQVQPNTQVYICAPPAFLAEVRDHAERLGIAKDQLQCVSLVPVVKEAARAAILELARSGKRVSVAPEQPLLHALQMAGIAVKSKCCSGECGTCVQQILAGEADHRDEVLSPALRAQGKICVCVSRAKSDVLVLDL